MSAVVLTVRQCAKLFGSHRKLWIPFLIVAVVEAFGILLLWLAPQPPFSSLLAPPIRYFFGDRVLHYPLHLWFLYHAMKHTHLVASMLVGAFMSGMACVMVRQAHEGRRLSFRNALLSHQTRYGTLLVVWLIVLGVAHGSAKGLGQWLPKTALGGWALIVASVLLQTLFAYAIPAVVYNRARWWRGLVDGVLESARYPFSTLVVVLMPSLFLIGFGILASPERIAQLMVWTIPEVGVPFMVLRLVVWTVADAVMTVAVAHLWWAHRLHGHTSRKG